MRSEDYASFIFSHLKKQGVKWKSLQLSDHQVNYVTEIEYKLYTEL